MDFGVVILFGVSVVLNEYFRKTEEKRYGSEAPYIVDSSTSGLR